MSRNLSRIKALFELYQYDLMNKEVNLESFDNLLEEAKLADNENDINYNDNFVKKIFNGVIDNINTIDRIIAINLENYPIDRLSYIDRNLIRIGTYEMTYTDTPHTIIINEIVNISKEYSQIDDYETSKFNNALLDKISKFILAKKENK